MSKRRNKKHRREYIKTNKFKTFSALSTVKSEDVDIIAHKVFGALVYSSSDSQSC